MVGIWGFRWLRFFLSQYKENEFDHISEEDRREHILNRLENAKFPEYSWVVVVAGVGFFTDAYCIFSINVVVPMLGIVYWQGDPNQGTIPHYDEIALSAVTLGGSIIGQIVFGLGADLWGRRKMYGLELMITIGAALGVVMCSNGIDGSVSIMTWLLLWRFVLGIGIGAGYPLSAVICSEFAPSRMRGKMLTAIFFCQPLGQLAAALVALIALARQRDGLSDGTVANCTGTMSMCQGTVDSIWRWVVGVGVIPAFVALWFRLTIIESPRYTADVDRDSVKAASELDRYLLIEIKPETASATYVDADRQLPTTIDADLSGDLSQRRSTTEMAIINTSEYYSLHEAAGIQQFPDQNDSDNHALDNEARYEEPPEPSWEDFKDYFWRKGNLRTLIATSLCWFCVDLPFYGLGMSSPRIIQAIWSGKDSTGESPGVFDYLVTNQWQSLVVVSIGAIVGCLITFVAIDKLGRRIIQIVGFFWLFLLFIIIGASYKQLFAIHGTAATIVLYILCQIFYNFGPNTTTYIIAAELFPTRYRGLCHGISAASGKLGSVIAQLFLGYISYGSRNDGSKMDYRDIVDWLPYSLLILSSFMLCGLIITILWIPGDEENVKTLEQWQIGRGPNGFSTTWLAKKVEVVYKWIVKLWDKIYMWLDSVSGGDVAHKRSQADQQVAA